jgi:histidinol-phosphate aminotransferase
VAIANPNNPTGTVLGERDLLRIVEAAARVGAVALVDEAYFYFYPGTVAPYCRRFPNLVVTRTFSKACGLAGVRLGYAVGHAGVIASVRKLQPIDHASSFAIRCGEYLLDHEDLIWQHVRQVERGKRYLARALGRLGFAVRTGFANFVLVDLGARKERIARALEKSGILVATNIRLPFAPTHARMAVGSVAQMRRVVDVVRGCRR